VQAHLQAGLPQPPPKPGRWVTRRYFGQFNPSRRNHWASGDAASGAYLPRLAWTPSIWHRKVNGRA
jgi:RNA-directed DNA polymerase